jgi:O-antigen/teichoic acid export membrane protein
MVSTTNPSSNDGPRIDDGSERADDGRHETREERLDRNTTEMVQELRVGAVGVQVLFAFLLVVPFNAGWKLTTGFEHGVYYVTLICIAVATVLLIAPSVHHRMLFREGEKPFLIALGNRLMIIGMVFVAAGMAGIFVLLSDFLFGPWAATVGGVVAAAVTASLWFGIPFWHRAHR